MTRDERLAQVHERTLLRQQKRDPEPQRLSETYFSDGYVLPLEIFVPSSPAPEGGRPGVLFFFGGAFISGCKEAFEPQAIELAKQGYVTACADYRVKALYGTSPRESIADGIAAWRYFLENALRYGMDPDRAALVGGSAGAVIVMRCILDGGADPCAAVLFNPGLSREGGAGGPMVAGVPIDNLLTAGDLREGLPPMLILHGEGDTVVPIDLVRDFAARAGELGNDVRLITYPEVGHGFFNYNGSRVHYFLSLGELLRFLNDKTGGGSRAQIVL